VVSLQIVVLCVVTPLDPDVGFSMLFQNAVVNLYDFQSQKATIWKMFLRIRFMQFVQATHLINYALGDWNRNHKTNEFGNVDSPSLWTGVFSKHRGVRETGINTRGSRSLCEVNRLPLGIEDCVNSYDHTLSKLLNNSSYHISEVMFPIAWKSDTSCSRPSSPCYDSYQIFGGNI
jgi:hypothetical protein